MKQTHDSADGEKDELTTDPRLSGNEELFLEVEERLKNSPNIPEEWKTRTPLEWFQFYLETLRKDAAGDSNEAVAVLEDFVEFVKETGITDLKDLCSEETSTSCGVTDEEPSDTEGEGISAVNNSEDRNKPAEKISLDSPKIFTNASAEKLPDVVDRLWGQNCNIDV